MVSLPVALLSLVPSGTVGSGLYDVIRLVTALFPFKPALSAITSALDEAGSGLGLHRVVGVALPGIPRVVDRFGAVGEALLAPAPPVRRRTRSRQLSGVSVSGSSGCPVISASRWVPRTGYDLHDLVAPTST